jgi:small subunit ribosomal protein S1
MVHKSDHIVVGAKINNPSDLYKKNDDVEAIILSINHDEKKVSLGIKQLWDDPWPTIFNEFPPGKTVACKVLSVVDYGVFVALRDGVEGLIPQNELVVAKDESGNDQELRVGEECNAEIANIDTQERRLTLSMRLGEAVASSPASDTKPHARASKAPKKSAAAEAAGGTIGELIKQKLGSKLASLGAEKQSDKVDDVEGESVDEEEPS